MEVKYVTMDVFLSCGVKGFYNYNYTLKLLLIVSLNHVLRRFHVGEL